MTRLGDEPFIDATATVKNSVLGRYTEVGAGCHVSNSTLGDYSYCVENTQIAYAKIGKFANIAAHVRIYASRHPTELASLHHFTYRSSWYFDGEPDNQAFFDWRAEHEISIGHDTWIGHGAVIMPGVSIGTGAVIGSGAVVTKDVGPYQVAVGVAAKVIKQRFPDSVIDRLLETEWWNWDRTTLEERFEDLLDLDVFLYKYSTIPA